jgi:hypothetical protein
MINYFTTNDEFLPTVVNLWSFSWEVLSYFSRGLAYLFLAKLSIPGYSDPKHVASAPRQPLQCSFFIQNRLFHSTDHPRQPVKAHLSNTIFQQIWTCHVRNRLSDSNGLRSEITGP